MRKHFLGEEIGSSEELVEGMKGEIFNAGVSTRESFSGFMYSLR